MDKTFHSRSLVVFVFIVTAVVIVIAVVIIIIIIKRRSGKNPIPPTVKDWD